MNDDAIRESHRCKCLCVSSTVYEPRVLLRENDDSIVFSICGATAELTRWQACYIASKLYRLARRIRDRGGDVN